jgi:amidophosphoribosyltransferase
VALDSLGFEVVRDVAPGEAIFIDQDGHFYSQQCAAEASLNPCIFEFVYLARPDSVIDGISVYETRLRMGVSLAEKITRQYHHIDIDVVIPIPDSSRPAAMELSKRLNLPYREGFIKNRYIGRTFIMPGQEQREKSVRSKLNAIDLEFRGKNVLLVDDSIVRGTTSREIVHMARESGANRVIFASAAPPVRFPNVYGIDMPTRSELIAHGRSDDEIRRMIEADGLVYQDIDAMKRSVSELGPHLTNFEASCFDGVYITGDVTPDYLDRLEAARELASGGDGEPRAQLNLNLASTD